MAKHKHKSGHEGNITVPDFPRKHQLVSPQAAMPDFRGANFLSSKRGRELIKSGAIKPASGMVKDGDLHHGFTVVEKPAHALAMPRERSQESGSA